MTEEQGHEEDHGQISKILVIFGGDWGIMPSNDPELTKGSMMPALAEGDKAPDFTLPASTGEQIRLAEVLLKSNVVLYFYPKDMTPGCTAEACSFRDLGAEFAEAGAVILGVSADTLESHAKFSDKHELNFPLLSDLEGKVAQQYGVWKEKNNYGKKKMGVERTTFVIDKQGTIRRIYPKVKVNEHAEAVLEVVRTLGEGGERES